MNPAQITFDDGAAYEGYMGVWSRLAGTEFLDWLAPPAGGRWADVGCGNGAFTELLLRCSAASLVEGIDPSEEQLAFARDRLANQPVRFQKGDATALPFADAVFDGAVMALVIFFVPDPAKGVAEMVRVVKPGGSVSAYAWDMLGGGFPYAAMREEMESLGAPMLAAPSVDASRMDALRALWADAGLADIETRRIAVRRSFDDFETFWRVAQTGPRMAPRIASMARGDVDGLEARLRSRLPPDDDGRITYAANANAIKGRVPR